MFSIWMYNKLKLKKIGLWKILKKIYDNTYVLELSEVLNIFSTLNISNSYKYEEWSTSREEPTIDW